MTISVPTPVIRIANSSTQAIEPKRQRQVECWSPGCRDAERPAAADDRERVHEVARKRRRDSREQQRPNTPPPQPAGDRQRQKRGQDDGDVKCCRRHVRLRSLTAARGRIVGDLVRRVSV